MKKLLIALLLAMLVWAAEGSGAQPPLPPAMVAPDFSKIQLGPYCDYLRDPSDKLTIDQVSRPPFSDKFTPHKGDSFDFGLDLASYWYRFRLDAPGGEFPAMFLALTRVIVPEMDLHLPESRGLPGTFRRLRAGFKYFGEGHDLGRRVRVVALPRDIKPGAYIYLRAKSKVVSYELTLQSEKALGDSRNLEFLFYGVLGGVMLAMLLYNLAISLFLRDKVYAVYCAYISMILGHSLLLTGFALDLGLSPGRLMSLILLFSNGGIFFAILFATRFLNTKASHPLLHVVFVFLMCLVFLSFCLVPAGFWDLSNAITYFFGTTIPIFMVGAAIRVWRSGYTPARYYLLAWAVLLACVIGYAATAWGLAPYSFVVSNLTFIGGAAEAILLALALADRIKTLERESARLREEGRRLTHLSITDPLTGLYNRRWFSSKLAGEISHCQRMGIPLCLLMMDVDRFKDFNDSHGHATGDRVLSGLGKVMNRNLRAQDTPCRYGGEEFAAILPGIDAARAAKVAERLRRDFEKFRVKATDHRGVGATISLGVAELKPDEEPESLFERADRALYQAKDQGRNRVVVLD